MKQPIKPIMKPNRTALWAFFLAGSSLLHVSAQDLSGKALEFLNTLSSELRAQTQFPMDDDQREFFHFVPMVRRGPTFHDFNANQKEAALGLLQASLSAQGYRKSLDIMSLENVLIALEDDYRMPDGSPMRDALNYHFLIFGDPSPSTLWGWRFEGHHLSLHFNSAKGTVVASTPTFFGANPAIVPIAPEEGKQVLNQESTLAFSFLESLSETQREKALFSETAPRGIITGNKREVALVEPMGIAFTDLNPSQQAAFLELLEVYIGNYIFEFSETFRKKITDAGLENLHFAWAGGTRWGTPHYYRIQGPMLIIEYDNTQNNGNHVHTVVRDLTNDFAEDFLREHYRESHRE